TAEFKLTLNSDSTLTAVFAKATANDKDELAQWIAYAENGQIVLRSNVPGRYEVYSVSGVQVSRGVLNGECRVDVRSSGLYMVRRISSTGISVRKVMVR
ncbi:MAG: T9SS type A sorting domain-containing protein, partial [Bacteroides sp.]|nr:T9SS type A sorting domain-containing protein [Bacteroides sp.]